jgi:anti-sigma B factor antagonist
MLGRSLREEVAALMSKEPDARSLSGQHVGGHSISQIVPADNGVTLAVAGEIDISNADEFVDDVRWLVGSTKGDVVLSLENCGFIDSAGARALIVLARELQMRGQTLVLSGLDGEPRRVLELTDLLEGRAFAIRGGAPDMSAG